MVAGVIERAARPLPDAQGRDGPAPRRPGNAFLRQERIAHEKSLHADLQQLRRERDVRWHDGEAVGHVQILPRDEQIWVLVRIGRQHGADGCAARRGDAVIGVAGLDHIAFIAQQQRREPLHGQNILLPGRIQALAPLEFLQIGGTRPLQGKLGQAHRKFPLRDISMPEGEHSCAACQNKLLRTFSPKLSAGRYFRQSGSCFRSSLPGPREFRCPQSPLLPQRFRFPAPSQAWPRVRLHPQAARRQAWSSRLPAPDAGG